MRCEAGRIWQLAATLLLVAGCTSSLLWVALHHHTAEWLQSRSQTGVFIAAAVTLPSEAPPPRVAPLDLLESKASLVADSDCKAAPGPFSQYGEDQFAWNNFFYGRRHGLFLELGGYNGCTFSNTLLLERGAGWQGILVEPSPRNFRNMTAARPAATCVHAAVCASPTVVHFIDSGAVGGIAEFMSPEHRARWHPSLKNMTALPSVSCLPLRDMLQYLRVKHIDFWSLDVEGAEMSVSVDVIVLETDTNLNATRHLLEGNGMTLFEQQEHNSWFVRKGFMPSSSPQLPEPGATAIAG